MKGVVESPQDFQNNFAFYGGPGDWGGLIWTKGCSRAWDAKYKFGCEANNTVVWSEELPAGEPMYHWYWQGPKIRISPNGPTKCAQSGGLVRIKRKRPYSDKGAIWEDITDKVRGFDTVSAYDKKDAILYDNYKIDC